MGILEFWVPYVLTDTKEAKPCLRRVWTQGGLSPGFTQTAKEAAQLEGAWPEADMFMYYFKGYFRNEKTDFLKFQAEHS